MGNRPEELGSSASANSHRELTRLQDQNRLLREKLERIRQQRKETEALRTNTEAMRASIDDQINSAMRQQEQALLDFQSELYRMRTYESMISCAQEWDAMHDCFHISHRGPFATINGLRLGAEAPPVDSGGTTTDTATVPPSSSSFASESRGYFSFVASSSATSNTKATDVSTGSKGQAAGGSLRSTPIKVPWTEINSALGQVALLLCSLEKRPHSGIKFRHEIVHLGSTSKIGVRRGGDNSPPTLYNLFSDDGFQFFGRRNFNIALECLLDCVEDAASVIQERDRTIALPYAIGKSLRGESTVGGLPIVFGTDGVEWTRAMKYLLTDLKHLMTYRVLGLWGCDSLAT